MRTTYEVGSGNGFFYTPAYKTEKYGQHSFGLKLELALGRDFCDEDREVINRACEELEQKLLIVTLKNDKDLQEKMHLERQKLMTLFGHQGLYANDLPNGYCNNACCSQRPWFEVQTNKGKVTIGWRKRVIQISWEERVNARAEVLFPNEEVTKEGRLIHAYGYEKAQEYMNIILGPTQDDDLSHVHTGGKVDHF